MDEKQILEGISRKLKGNFGVSVENASKLQLYKAVSSLARDQIMEQWIETNKKMEKNKKRLWNIIIKKSRLGCCRKSRK